MTQLILPSCECTAVARSFRSAARKNERYVGTGHLIAVRGELDSTDAASVLVSFNSTAGGLLRADGTFVDRTPALRNTTEQVVLLRRASGWRIRHVLRVPAGKG
jgi:hypothetical protein